MLGYGYRKRWILTQKEDLNSRHLNSHPPLFLVFTNVTIWFLEWDPELHLEETFKIICSNPFILQKEHRDSERGSLQLVSGWVGSRTQASWLWAEVFFLCVCVCVCFFFAPLPGTKEELGKRFRRPNTGLACGINVHLSHGICYLQLCSCYGICCSVFWLCAWFAILGHSKMLPQSPEQWSVNLMSHTVICELNCCSST